MATPAAFKLLYPRLRLNTGTTEVPVWVDLQCSTRNLTHSYETETVDNGSACAPFAQSRSITGESITLSAWWSFGSTSGSEGFFNTMYALRDTVVGFELENDSRLTSADAGYAVMVGTLQVPPDLQFLTGTDLKAKMQGDVELLIQTGGSDSITFGTAA